MVEKRMSGNMEGTAEDKEHKRRRAVLEHVSAEGDSKFARALGSVDAQTRSKGLQALTLWLSKKEDIDRLDLLKLWKGLFYAFWHSDKSPAQIALAEKLAELVVTLPLKVTVLYYETFLETMRREWFGIDHLRIDKFMMLVRKFFFSLLERVQDNNWDVKSIREVTACWLPEVLLPQDGHASTGFAYHLTDLFVVELQRVVTKPDERPSNQALLALFEPFCEALARSSNKALLFRLRQGIFNGIKEELESPSEMEPLRELSVVDLATHLFDLGARPETLSKNRQACYATSRMLESIQRAGKESTIPEESNGIAKDTTEEVQAAKSGPKKTKKKKKLSVNGVVKPVSEPSTTESDTGLPIPKRKKQKPSIDNGQAESNGKAAEPVEEEAPSEQPTPAKKTKKQRPVKADVPARRVTEASAVNGPTTTATVPPSTPNDLKKVAEAEPPRPSTQPKAVRFSLKRNLVMTIGEPPAPADVRTPPSSKPKGSALKRSSLLGMKTALGKSTKPSAARRLSLPTGAAGTSATPLLTPGKKKARRSSFGAGRPKASDFF